MTLIDTSKCTTPAEAGIERMRALYALIGGVPEEHVALESWRRRTGEDAPENKRLTQAECGTTGCAIGWATAHPEFIAQGLKWSGLAPYYSSESTGLLRNWDAIAEFFQISRDLACYIFLPSAERAWNVLSEIFPSHSAIEAMIIVRAESNQLSHKQLVMARILRHLKSKGAITQERFNELAPAVSQH